MISRINFLTVLLAFAAAGLMGNILMPLLIRIRLVSVSGKADPVTDNGGLDIPPGGGIIIMISAAAASAIGSVCYVMYTKNSLVREDTYTVSAVFAVIGGALGFYGDYLKASGKPGGISPLSKTASEIILVAVYLIFRFIQGGTQSIFIPFMGYLPLGTGYYFIAGTVMLAVIRSFECAAVTDGVMSASGGVFFLGAVLISSASGAVYPGIRLAALSGSCLGFLIWNFPPAKTSCGMSGALFAGFSAAAAAAESGQLILICVMLIPIFIEGISCMMKKFFPGAVIPLSALLCSKKIAKHYVVMFYFIAAVIAAAAGNAVFICANKMGSYS